MQSAILSGAWMDPVILDLVRGAFYRARIEISGKSTETAI